MGSGLRFRAPGMTVRSNLRLRPGAYFGCVTASRVNTRRQADHDGSPVPDQPDALIDRLTQAPPVSDRERAGERLADFLDRAEADPDCSSLLPRLDGGLFRDLILSIADHSPFLWQVIVTNPARLQRLTLHAPEQVHAEIVQSQATLFRGIRAGILSRDDAVAAFRQNRNAHALLVALADIGGVWDVVEVTRALSEFADSSVRGGVNLVLTEMADLGRIILRDPEDPGDGSGFTVLALGKHGAGELNYSSDIDLVVFFDPQSPALPEGAEAPTLYTRIAQQLARLLQERTADGYVHRVDYRLRPDPGSTPTVS
jgi:[glutamine synthetase] adenylyltransferase / [glutamine synthetase]-adenylyl-L-tyrosine phosphorylase